MNLIEIIFKKKLILKLENQVDSALSRCDELEREISRHEDLVLQNRVLKLYIDNDDDLIELIEIAQKVGREDAFDQRVQFNGLSNALDQQSIWQRSAGLAASDLQNSTHIDFAKAFAS